MFVQFRKGSFAICFLITICLKVNSANVRVLMLEQNMLLFKCFHGLAGVVSIVLQSITILWYCKISKYCNTYCKISKYRKNYCNAFILLQNLKSIAKIIAKSIAKFQSIARFQSIAKIIVIFCAVEVIFKLFYFFLNFDW